jgi:tetratricopeptide (TPR) repeat protein
MAERFAGEIDDLYQKWISSPSAVVGARLADRLRVSGRLDEAAEIAGQALEEWPGNMSLQVVLGRCHLDGGRLDEARESFAAVRSRDPLNLVALRSLADIAVRQESWDEAVELIEEYLFENPTDEEAEQMLEKAKLARKEQPAGPAEEADGGPVEQSEGGAEASEKPEEFPETRRMEKILAGQGQAAADGGAEADGGGGEDDDSGVAAEDGGSAPASGGKAAAEPAVSGMRREPRSLLDLFTEGEREELGLKPFEEGG